MLCKRCAAIIEDGSKICIHCGADQEKLKKKNKNDDIKEREAGFFDHLITFFVGGIPLIGLIMLMIWSFGPKKIKGRSSVAKAFLLWSAFVTLLILIVFIYLCYFALQNADIQ